MKKLFKILEHFMTFKVFASKHLIICVHIFLILKAYVYSSDWLHIGLRWTKKQNTNDS